MARRVTTTVMIATSEDNDNEDGNGAMGDEVDDDGDNVTCDGATGYDDDKDNGGGTMNDKVDNYGEGRRAKARRATTMTTTKARRAGDGATGYNDVNDCDGRRRRR